MIPARYGSQRFPGKPLAILWGKPLLQHVWERAREVRGLDELVIATDDDRIAQVARGFGAIVEMTPIDLVSGTDRVAVVVRSHPAAEIVVNLQGDEPELDPGAVTSLVAGMRNDPSILMATLAHGWEEGVDWSAPELVKLAVDEKGDALYFTRSEPRVTKRDSVLRHIGVYGYRREFLEQFAAWPASTGERAERLEQLRAMERGVKIRVFQAARPFSGVDTPQQLEALERRGPAATEA